MNDNLKLLEVPPGSPERLSVRFNVRFSEWLVYDSLAERVVSKGHKTEVAAEAVLKNLISRRTDGHAHR